MKKIIFLDFDGVITTAKSRWDLDPEKLELLGELLEKTGAEIVISSSWRNRNIEETIKYLSDKGKVRGGVTFPFCDKVIGVTIRAYQYIKGIHLSIPRGVEIAQWLDVNVYSDNGKNYCRYVDFRYVILDDDMDMLLTQKDNFIHTDTYEGLSKEDVLKAIEILNG